MTLKIGLIGCGGITRAHVEGWKGIAHHAEIVAVADVSRENALERAAQIGTDPEIVSDYRDLLVDKEIDAVDISLPPPPALRSNRRRGTSRQTLDDGKNTLPEPQGSCPNRQGSQGERDHHDGRPQSALLPCRSTGQSR